MDITLTSDFQDFEDNVVGIVYTDITHIQGGNIMDDPEPLIYFAFGVILKEDENKIVLGQIICSNQEEDRMNCSLYIPKGCILKIIKFTKTGMLPINENETS